MTGSNLQRNKVNAGTPANWYVVETNARQERTANFQLRRLGFQPYLPMRPSASKRVDAMEATPLFPSYLFLLDPAEKGWSSVRAAPGVRSVFLGAGKPAVAPQGLVEALRAHEVYGLVQLHASVQPTVSPFQRGDRLRIIAGQLVGFDGFFETMADRKRVWMLLSILGRESRISVPIGDVKKSV